jgi:ribose 1,5-bisphosphokinase
MLVLIVGPSGAGKDTLLDAVHAGLANDEGVRFARREITRPRTPGGEDHLPVDVDAFKAKRDAGGYALWWEAHGFHYGICSSVLADSFGVTVVASVSRAIIAEAATRFKLRVVEITAPQAALSQRLAARGRENAEDIALRLQREVAIPDDVDRVTIMNDGSIEEGAAKVLAALRLR